MFRLLLIIVFYLDEIQWYIVLFVCIHLISVLTCEVTSSVDGCFFMITFVCGFNSPSGHQDLWCYLGLCVIDFQSTPWLILGDFNAMMILAP